MQCSFPLAVFCLNIGTFIYHPSESLLFLSYHRIQRCIFVHIYSLDIGFRLSQKLHYFFGFYNNSMLLQMLCVHKVFLPRYQNLYLKAIARKFCLLRPNLTLCVHLGPLHRYLQHSLTMALQYFYWISAATF